MLHPLLQRLLLTNSRVLQQPSKIMEKSGMISFSQWQSLQMRFQKLFLENANNAKKHLEGYKIYNKCKQFNELSANITISE